MLLHQSESIPAANIQAKIGSYLFQHYLAQGHVCYCDKYQHGVTLALT